MKFPPTRIRCLAVAVAASALLTACSTHHTPSSGPARPAAPTTDGTSHPAGTTSPRPSSAPTGLSAWPTKPATSDKFPSDVRGTAFAKGYSGTVYLDRLSKRWHIKLSPRRENDFNKRDRVPPVWISSGTAHPSDGSKMSIALVWSLAGELESLTCITDRNAPGYADFLRDCVELDHPDARPDAAASWLEQVKPSVDKAYAQAKRPVGSPLYRSGRAVSYLLEYNNGKEGMTYTVRVFGAPR